MPLTAWSPLAQVLATRYLESSSTLVATAIKVSASFLKLFNGKAIPFLSAYFRPLNKEVMDLLKQLQPATRLLQAHCASIKEKRLLSALKPVPRAESKQPAAASQRSTRGVDPVPGYLSLGPHCLPVRCPSISCCSHAALQVAMLKKELEAILFKVRVMLSAHGCPEGFWMGNLKHKNVAGACCERI